MKVLLLDLDSTNPEHLGCYGYHRNTSPHIDRIAHSGVTFTNYYTSDAPCCPSRNALMSGKFGIHNGAVGHGGTAADQRLEGKSRQFQSKLHTDSLPAIFKAQGMKTALISPFAERHSTYTFYAGFQEIYDTGKNGMESAEEVTPTVLQWLDRQDQEEDWFLYVNYWDPHTPYRAPEPFGNPFANEPIPSWLTEDVFEQHKQKIGPHSVHEINMYNDNVSPDYPRHPGKIEQYDELRRMIDGYDSGIRYMDSHLGQIFDHLEQQGVMDEIVIIITSDHGENMGQLGIYGEHGTADQGTCRIPMIMRWPGAIQGHVDHGLHYHLDLLPTVAEILRQPAPADWDGQSYAPVILRGEDAGREYLVVSQCAHVCQRSVRFGDYLYIRTYHDGYHLFDKEMLFNLKDDPHEIHNLAAARPELCREAVYLLNEWHDDAMMTMTDDIDPLWTVMREGGPYHARGHLAAYARHLESTGRSHAIPLLQQRHPQEKL
ncbi:sulfatase family protein [Paenibacillus daejeonensis]|uniref:sulfatase family protein n=1 Tax=Paenibacillus daejeonensis TaxID=135193 RepID=UPI000361DE46|nr:sulfatase-like hydrolase/transferase [Paenibacillus daejeonensis]